MRELQISRRLATALRRIGRMDKHLAGLIMLFVLLLVCITPWVHSDGWGYYAYIRSIVIDGDLHFENEFVTASVLDELPPPNLFIRGKSYDPGKKYGERWLESGIRFTETGYVGNHWSVGPALLWAPFFLTGHAVTNLLGFLGLSVAPDGYSLPYTLSVAFASNLYAFMGLILIYFIGRRMFCASTSFLAVVMIWFASPLPAYMYGHPSTSHPVSAFAASLFVFLWYTSRPHRTKIGWFLLGLSGGLLIAIRPHDIIFLLLPALETLGKLRRGVDGANEGIPLRKLLLGTVLMVLGILLAYSPQLAVSKVLYGKYLVNPIIAHLGQEAWDMWADFSHPRFFHVLFSPRIGLFSWTPVLIFAVAGLYWLYLKDRLTGVLFFMILMLEIYIVASWEKGEQGSSFGGRIFISCTPIFILGLASLIDRLRQIISMKSIVIAGLVFIIWNLGLVLQFAMGWYPRMYNLGEVSWSEVVRNQFLRVPAYLLDRVIALIRGV